MGLAKALRLSLAKHSTRTWDFPPLNLTLCDPLATVPCRREEVAGPQGIDDIPLRQPFYEHSVPHVADGLGQVGIGVPHPADDFPLAQVLVSEGDRSSVMPVVAEFVLGIQRDQNAARHTDGQARYVIIE